MGVSEACSLSLFIQMFLGRGFARASQLHNGKWIVEILTWANAYEHSLKCDYICWNEEDWERYAQTQGKELLAWVANQRPAHRQINA